jgi:DNA-binding transcriptional ArsR family regulator
MWNIQDWIDTVVPIKKNHQGTVTPEPLDLSEEELLQKMLSSHDKELIERFMDGDETLWEGEGARYESRSHADQGFLRKMAFWTRGDRERMRKITLSSRMRREKWNRKGYLDNLIEQGISYCGGNFYDPHNTGKVIEELYHLRMNTSWNSMNACHLLSGFLSLAYMYGRYIPGEGVYVYGSVRNLNLRSRIVNPDSKDHITVTQTWRVLEEMGYIKEIFKGGSPGRPNKASLYLIPEPTHTSTPSEYIHIDERQGGGERRGMSLSFVYVI